MRHAHSALSTFCAAMLLTGCGFTVNTIAPVHTAAKGIHGTIMGGQQPVVGSTVTVYVLGTGGSATAALAQTTTDGYGNFEFNTTPGNSYSCPAGPLEPSAGTGARSTTPVNGDKTELTSSQAKISIVGTTYGAKSQARPALLPDLTKSYVYVTAAGGDSGGGLNSSILLAAGLGACPDAQNEAVQINEVSTVVFATAMQNFYTGTGIFGTGATSYEAISAMDAADTSTVQNIVDLSTGLVKPNVATTEPGGTSITIEAAKIYSYANVIASCVNSADDVTDPLNPKHSQACANLSNALPASVSDTLRAAILMAYAPYYNVAGLWALASSKPPFEGGLSSAPNDWTIGMSYTTNTMGLGLYRAPDGSPTSSNIDIDSSGRVWFPSNKSGATGLGYFDPTETSFGGPFGGTFLTQPQYIALDDATQRGIVTDVASAGFVVVDIYPYSSNAVTAYAYNDHLGGTLPPGEGPIFVNSNSSFDFALTDTQGSHDMIYISENIAIGGPVGSFVESPTGLTLNTTLGTHPNDTNSQIGVAATSGPSSVCSLEVVGDSTQGSLPSPISSTESPCLSGGVAAGPVVFSGSGLIQDEITASVTPNEICSQIAGECFEPTVTSAVTNKTVNLARRPMGVAFDGGDQVWLANSGNASIATFTGNDDSGDPSPGSYNQTSDRFYAHDQANGGTMISPTGIAIDAAGNIWVSNATCASATDTTCSFTLSEVVGSAYPTITPLASQVNQMQGTEPSVAARAAALKKIGLVKGLSHGSIMRGKR